MDIQTMLNQALEKLDAMSVDEFSQSCQLFGYTPIPKKLVYTKNINIDFSPLKGIDASDNKKDCYLKIKNFSFELGDYHQGDHQIDGRFISTHTNSSSVSLAA